MCGLYPALGYRVLKGSADGEAVTASQIEVLCIGVSTSPNVDPRVPAIA